MEVELKKTVVLDADGDPVDFIIEEKTELVKGVSLDQTCTVASFITTRIITPVKAT